MKDRLEWLNQFYYIIPNPTIIGIAIAGQATPHQIVNNFAPNKVQFASPLFLFHTSKFIGSSLDSGRCVRRLNVLHESPNIFHEVQSKRGPCHLRLHIPPRARNADLLCIPRKKSYNPNARACIVRTKVSTHSPHLRLFIRPRRSPTVLLRQ